jgi:hypothetical protein
MYKYLISGLILLLSVFVVNTTAVATEIYKKYYNDYVNYGNYWVSPTKIGTTSFPAVTALGINDLSTVTSGGAGGSAIVSESMGYAMILAALYNDQATFDKLSATIQAGIPLGKSNNTSTNLFPWSWQPSGTSNDYIPKNSGGTNPYDSASDGDVNIALSYVYADMAAKTYGWSATPLQGSTLSYKSMAQAYITAIRKKDFTYNTSVSTFNTHILAMGADSAISGIYDWRPDYSDIRAYQLFALYDTSSSTFWNDAIAYTREAWKAVFYFGSEDTGRLPWDQVPPTGVDIQASSKNVWISNHSYGNLTFSSDYHNVKAVRYSTKTEADSSRMPVRIMNYVNATQNSADNQMRGIASSIMSALGSTYATTSNYKELMANMNIWTPWVQDGGVYVQDYIASGLLGLASNDSLSSLASSNMNKSTALNNLNSGFGTDGTNGTFTWQDKNDHDLNKPLPDLNNAFNASLSLWGMTVSKDGHTPLQTAVDLITSGTTVLFEVRKTGRVKSVKLNMSLLKIGNKKIKVTLTSPNGRTIPIMNQFGKDHIVLKDRIIGGFKGISAKGKWRLNINGSSSVKIGVRSLGVAVTPLVATYQIGGPGPAGGRVFYLTDASGEHGMEAAPGDQSVGIQWGCYGTYVKGTSTAFGKGNANTNVITAKCGTGIAALTAANYSLNGFSDWFLPSKAELNTLYNNKKVVGGFVQTYYWSSSSNNDLQSWGQHFNGGTLSSASRNNPNIRVRAVRSF